MTLKAKLAVLCGLLTAIVALQTIVLLAGNIQITQSATQISNLHVPTLNKAHTLKLAVVQTQQWLTDISATRGLDGLNDGFDEADANAKLFRALINELQTLDAENASSYRSMLPLFENYYETGKDMANSYIDGGPSTGNQMMAEFDAAALNITKKVDTLLTRIVTTTNRSTAEQQSDTGKASYYIAVSVIVIFLVVGVLFFVMTTSIKELPIAVAALADGDLTRSLDVTRTDEIGDVMRSLQKVRSKMLNIISNITDTTSKLSASADTMTQISTDTSNSIDRLHAEAEQSATAMTEMTATTHEVSGNIAHTAAAAQQANTETLAGKEIMEKTIGQITGLAQRIEQASNIIQHLEENTNEITSVLEVIKAIADQTNLLALNAAIEAARAGEQGRGFAVVADEVRTLASRTQQSTDEINQMIEKLKSGSQKAVETMHQSRDQVLATVDQASLAGQSLELISKSVDQINQMSIQIASSAEEQSSVAEEVNRSMVNISDMANTSAQGARDTSKTSSELENLAEFLNNEVKQYTT